ncbi:MAG: hypothetical protein DMD96_00930 [Candidatus Rokuibacteriota bacterium]|nr:MAG: hypothetical protein DMD96_00930 [Candidatus Rokubacteria bacterium]
MSDDRAEDALKRVPSGVELTALDPTFRADPHPVLARLRQREPVHYDEQIKRWVLTRAHDIDRVLRPAASPACASAFRGLVTLRVVV